jgi:glycosyltransferase involved in cell wall biosynthesis
MKKIAMLTSFCSYLQSYSLCAIAKVQLKMFKRYGYPVRFIYRGGGGWESMVDEIVQIPDYIVDNNGDYSGMEKRSGKSLTEMVQDTLTSLETLLAGIDIVITHDLPYQPSNIIQDMAASLYSEKHPEVKWLHWIHSATSPKQLGKTQMMKYNNAFICYPNAWDVPRVARNFNVEESQVKVVPHPMDYEEFFKFHPLTVKLIEEKDLLSADAICIYPLRMDRGKQPEVVIEIFQQLKKYCKKSIRVVIIDFQSTGGDKVTFRKELMKKAVAYGWGENDLTFMSQFDSSCQVQTPVEVVRDLFLVSNVYIHPSKSETYSLTTQEARACGNILVLNADFPPMMSIYGEGPLYKKFSSNVDALNNTADGETTTNYSNRDLYMRDVACSIAYHLQYQDVVRMKTETRQNKNIDIIFRRHIEPILYSMQVE